MTRTSLLSACVSAGLLLAACAPTPPPAPPAPAAPVAAPAPPAPEPPPPPMPARPIEFPPFTETTLPNGLRLIVVERPGQPIANVDLYLETGSAADPVAKRGLTQMVATLLTKGTARRSAEQIARTIEGAGGTLNANATNDYLSVSADVTSDQLPLAFDLLSDVTLRPTFPEAELEIARTRELSGLQVALSQPSTLAQRRFLSAVYGERHPYSFAPVPQTVRAIRRADLRSFHDRYFKADNAMLVVAGDVDAQRVQQLARQHFGGWRGAGVPEVSFVEPPARERAQIYLVHRPGSVQSNILIGHVGIRPDNPDYYALQVLNRILGGGSDARLFTVLREQKGWTYGAYSRLSRPQDVGFFQASAEVRTPVTDSAIVEMLSQLRRIRTEPVSTEELEGAKSFLTGSFPLRIETPGQVAAQVAQVRLLGLPTDELTRYRDRIQAVTAQDVQRVAQQYVRPDQAAIVVVGDAAQLYDRLQAIAPVAAYSVEGSPIQASDFQVRAATERYSAAALRPMTLEYQVLAQGNPVGTATITLARDGEAWVGTQTVRAGPMTQEQTARFTSDFTPISARQAISQGPMQVEVDLRYAGGKVTGTAKLPPQMGGERAIDTEVPAGTVFSGMDQWILASASLAPGKTITLPLFESQAGSTLNASFQVTGTEQITVPAGTFQTYKLQGTVGPQQMTLWLRQDAPHIAVRQDPAGQPVSIVLQAVK